MGGTFSGVSSQSFGPQHDFVHQHSNNIKIMIQWKESNTLPEYFPDGKDGNPKTSMTALMAQAARRSSDKIETLTFLLDHKADPNLQANNGNTALHFAIISGDHPQKVLTLPLQS